MKCSLDGHLPWQFVLGSLPLWPFLAVCCLCSSGGRYVLLHGGLPSMFHDGLSSTVVVSHGDLSSIYVGWSGGHHFSSTGCWAVCGWGRISAGPPLFFSEMKLETSFSNVLQFALLASIQLSKVLKWTLLVLMSGVLKGVNFLLTLLPDLPRVLKWIKSLSWTCTGVLKGVNFCLCCSLLPRVPLVGVLKWLSSMYFSPLTRIPLICRVLNSAAKSSVGCSSS